MNIRGLAATMAPRTKSVEAHVATGDQCRSVIFVAPLGEVKEPMTSLLPEGILPRLTRRRDTRTLPHLDHLIVMVAADAGRSAWSEIPGGVALAAAARRRQRTKAGCVVTLHLPEPCPVTVGIVDPEAAPFAWLTVARKVAAEVRAGRPARVGVMAAGGTGETATAWLEAAISGLLAAEAPMPQFRREERTGSRLSSIILLDEAPGLDLERVRAEAEGNHLARWLTALPPNRLNAGSYRRLLEELAGREGWTFAYLDEAALAKLGAGAFLAVARSNPHRDAGIARLSYRPPGRADAAAPHVTLVGKGICFDTGGTNIKPFRAMLDMHEDMQGSAVALGALLALTRIAYPEPVDCWLAITENRIGPDAYNSRDVITAANGVTIEVIHTDAEGRMVLADALALAGRDRPGLMIDYATLTGACVAALTHRYSGVFGNRPALVQVAVEAGRSSGERLWPFPMDEDFDEALDSRIADVMQCSQENEGDHILAARFLQRFVPEETPWLHIDLSSSHHKGGLGLAPTPQTGFGVRLTLAMLVDHALGAAAAGVGGDAA
jgi:leucyl aminopeptidase